jgi:surfactin synthase thioesterase subunit
MSTSAALKAKAIDLFGESLGAVIATEIDEEIKKEKQDSTMKVLSWKTGFEKGSVLDIV